MKSQKETSVLGATEGGHGRLYHDACGMAFALELIGERWSMLIMRELLLGGRRFSDLRAGIPGISAKMLTERLGAMEAAGVLTRRKLPPPAASQVYELTEWGYMAEPAMQELARWATRSSAHNPQLPLSPVSLMISLRTMIDAEAAKLFDATVGFTVGADSFLAELKDGLLPVRRVDGPTDADVWFTVEEPLPILRLFYGKQPIEDAVRSGVNLTGDKALAQRFAALFSLPEKIV